ncbi:MAG: FkbM family methyltransferase [Azospirillum sp.]|nr:FkbM family methyltransferase [Azospirillum sp.]
MSNDTRSHTKLRAGRFIGRSIIRLAARLDRLASRIQGKGWAGPATVDHEAEAALSFLSSAPSVVIDVGANVGDYSAAVRARYAAAEIHAFEPSPAAATDLKRRFAADQLVTINVAALSDEASRVPLYGDRPGSRKSSLVKRDLRHYAISFDVVEEVEVVTFETYWRANLACRPIDIVKLDVEGFELKVLRGFGPAIDAVRVFQFELGGCAIDTRIYLRDFWHMFTERGFEIHRLSPFGPVKMEHYREQDESFDTTNYFAVSRRTEVHSPVKPINA